MNNIKNKAFLKALSSVMLALIIITAYSRIAVSASDPVFTDDQDKVYNAIISLKSEYPDGMKWTNENYYEWNGGYYAGGFGCAGFAFLLSDAAFGDAQARFVYDVSLDALRVGDILRINNDTHSVVVLSVEKDGVIVAEGNFNSSINWGRKLSLSTVNSATYYMTRYAEKTVQPIEEPIEDQDYKMNNGLIYNIRPGTQLDDFIKKLDLDAAVKDPAENDIINGIICTGYKVIIENETFVAAVKGDADGNGAVDSTDYILIKLHILNITSLDGAYLQAVDTDENGIIDSTDYISVKRHILNIKRF